MAEQWELALREYLLSHESDIFHGINDFGELRHAFIRFIHRTPIDSVSAGWYKVYDTS